MECSGLSVLNLLKTDACIFNINISNTPLKSIINKHIDKECQVNPNQVKSILRW